MRKFGTDSPVMFAFQIGDSKKVYEIPLAGDLPHRLLDKLREADDRGNMASFDAQVELLREYMGDIVDDLSTTVLSDILTAWGEESNKQGASPGES